MYVIIGIVILLLILMLAHIKFSVSFHDILKIKINYLFFRYNILPKKDKDKKNKKSHKIIQKKQSSKKKKSSFIKKAKNIKFVKVIINVFFHSAKYLVSKIKIKLINIDLSIAKENAYDTALNYGKICIALYPIINVILDNNKPKSYLIKIYPSFNDSKTLLNADLKFKITLLSLLICIVKILIEFIKYYIKIKTKKGVEI